MIGVVIAIGFLGFVIHIAAKFDPMMSFLWIDTIGTIICWIVPIVFVIYRLKVGQAMPYFKPPKKNNPDLEFLYRVGERRNVRGNRLPGTGFSNVPGLGIIQEIGVPGESVFRHGDKPIQMVMQDIAHTPNPKWFNVTYWFAELGISSLDSLYELLDGNNPQLMAKVWNKMQDMPQREPVEMFLDQLRNMDDKTKKRYDKSIVKMEKKVLKEEKKKTPAGKRLSDDFRSDMERMTKTIHRRENTYADKIEWTK